MKKRGKNRKEPEEENLLLVTLRQTFGPVGVVEKSEGGQRKPIARARKGPGEAIGDLGA